MDKYPRSNQPKPKTKAILLYDRKNVFHIVFGEHFFYNM